MSDEEPQQPPPIPTLPTPLEGWPIVSLAGFRLPAISIGGPEQIPGTDAPVGQRRVRYHVRLENVPDVHDARTDGLGIPISIYTFVDFDEAEVRQFDGRADLVASAVKGRVIELLNHELEEWLTVNGFRHFTPWHPR